MKKLRKSRTPLFTLLLALTIFSCKDKVTETLHYNANTPQYMSYDNLRSSVKCVTERTLVKPGKIYFYNDYLFINEYFEGIHVIDNSDPSNPTFKNFIEIRGNIDMTIKNGYLYADSYIDLVVLDISDLNDIKEVNRIENVFPYEVPEYESGYPVGSINEEEGVVVGWEINEVEETIDGTTHYGLYKYDAMTMNEMVFDGGNSSGDRSVGGSMARFATFNDYLYLLNETEMSVFSINTPQNPVSETKIQTNTIAETLFIYKENMFMGTQTGMIIYSLNTPSLPNYLTEFSHIQSCDPVVVEDDIAYVTLRDGRACGGFTNQLDVVDISTITAPFLIKSYPMTNPHGLGINNKTLFICDGDAGLKVFDATDPLKISDNIIEHFSDMNAFDVIPLGNLIMMIGSDGLYQYNYEAGVGMTQLSIIPVSSE
ncbi:MAG: hypothetical protein GY756_09040 [bacterium]|nr:hypothetical protein [bacterium]